MSLYQLNKEDFLAVARLLYLDVANDPDCGDIANNKKGFGCFCDLITECLLAAPTLSLGQSKDENGAYVNFFGDAILAHLKARRLRTIQDMYGSGGTPENTLVWSMVRDLAYYVGAEAFHGTEAFIDDAEIKEARKRIDELGHNKRSLKLLPQAPGGPFH
jgi:hypothetical protein